MKEIIQFDLIVRAVRANSAKILGYVSNQSSLIAKTKIYLLRSLYFH